MIHFIFIFIVFLVILVIVWANNTLHDEYRYKKTLDKENEDRRKSEGNKKDLLIGGKP